MCFSERLGLETTALDNNAQEMLGPNIPNSTCDGAVQFKAGLWVRKAADVKQENFMAFQGRPRI